MLIPQHQECSNKNTGTKIISNMNNEQCIFNWQCQTNC